MATRGTKQIRIGRVERLVKKLEIEKSAWERRLQEAEEHYQALGITDLASYRETQGERSRVQQLNSVMHTILKEFPELEELMKK